MDKTLQELGELLLKAVPTFILLVLLHFYLKRVFFRPLDKALQARNDAVEGARKLAEETQQRAERLLAEYEDALRRARADIYRDQEEIRRKWSQEHTAAAETSQRKAEALLKDSRAQLQLDVAEAKTALAAESDRLSGKIVESILRERKN